MQFYISYKPSLDNGLNFKQTSGDPNQNICFRNKTSDKPNNKSSFKINYDRNKKCISLQNNFQKPSWKLFLSRWISVKHSEEFLFLELILTDEDSSLIIMVVFFHKSIHENTVRSNLCNYLLHNILFILPTPNMNIRILIIFC